MSTIHKSIDNAGMDCLHPCVFWREGAFWLSYGHLLKKTRAQMRAKRAQIRAKSRKRAQIQKMYQMHFSFCHSWRSFVFSGTWIQLTRVLLAMSGRLSSCNTLKDSCEMVSKGLDGMSDLKMRRDEIMARIEVPSSNQLIVRVMCFMLRPQDLVLPVCKPVLVTECHMKHLHQLYQARWIWCLCCKNA